MKTSSPQPPLPPLALIAGPTASGKSALALVLAERSDGIIINADSAQVYKDLCVLSARPGKAGETKAPHLLYGYRDGASPCSAADWAADARTAICNAQAKGKLPILVGGTGLYLRTLLEGIAPVPDIDPEIRRDVRALAVEQAYAALAKEDAVAARRLRPGDSARIARALEVIRSTGKTLAEWQQRREGGILPDVALRPLILLPPRDWLFARCDARFEHMMGPEGIEEVRRLLERRLDPALPVMRAIGVPQIAALLQGEMDSAAALAAGKLATRQYAKRQFTWFRGQTPRDWPRFTNALDDKAAIEAALMLLGVGG